MARNMSLVVRPFEFELLTDGNSAFIWMKNHWHYSLFFSVVYLYAIHKLRKTMEKRPAFELKGTLVAWNILLAVFSCIVSIRVTPGFYYILSTFGFAASVCDPDLVFALRATMFWSLMFLLSKVAELGDTMFIVLRKRNLTFLHVYHHVATLIMSWYAASQKLVIIHWFLVMNSIVHSFMYTYYVIVALKFKVPRSVAACITSLQILQMVVGSVVASRVVIAKVNGEICDFHQTAMFMALIMYISYACLFCRFFYSTYIKSERKKKVM